MGNLPLPSVFSRAWPGLRSVYNYTPVEWRSECPRCSDSGHYGAGAPDRFVMSVGGKTGRPRGWCRRCGYFSFADRLVGDYAPSPEQIESLRRQQEKVEQRRRKILERFSDRELLNDLCRRMEPRHFDWWSGRGISREWVFRLNLGYRQDKKAYSIPYFDAAGHLVNIQYRIENSGDKNSRYRFEYGLKTVPYITRTDMPISGQVIVCEGAIKGMVTHIHGTQGKMQVLSVPSKSDFAGVSSLVLGCSRVYVILDPDSIDRSVLLCKEIGSASRLVDLPDKIDDMLLDGRLYSDGLRSALIHSRRVM